MKAEVRVSKAHGGTPQVQVAIPEGATPDQIATAVKAVYSSAETYRAAGLALCLHCKSGIDVAVVASFPEAFHVDTGN
jgi:hypothetical protein